MKNYHYKSRDDQNNLVSGEIRMTKIEERDAKGKGDWPFWKFGFRILNLFRISDFDIGV
jgi:hypothetical protein